MTYPTIRPSLTLDFSKSKKLDPRITFSRSSAATYVEGGVIKSAANNVSRFEQDGLLIEEARTNLATYSEDLSDSSWTKNSTTVTANATTAPDGNTTADKVITENNGSGTGNSIITKPVTTTAAVHTFSVFLKKDGRSFAMLYDASNAVGAYFNLTTGAVTTGGSGISASAASASEDIGNGWFRCSISNTTSAGTTNYRIYVTDSGSSYSHQGDGTSGIFAWGAQVELGSFPTSYIPTSGSTVTRSADVAEMTADNFSNWYNNSEGTIFVDTKAASLTNTVVASLSTNANNRMEVRSAGSSLTTSRFEVVESSSTQFSSIITNNNTYGNLALGYKLNNTNAAANGTLGTLDTAFSVPAVDNLYLGNNIFATTQRPGHIARLSFYNHLSITGVGSGASLVDEAVVAIGLRWCLISTCFQQVL